MENGTYQVNNTQAGVFQAEAASQVQANELPNSAVVGQWNYQQAQKIILPYLQKYNWKVLFPVHSFLGQYKLPYENKEAMLVATASINKGDQYFACPPILSFFEFEKQSNGWKLVNSFIAASRLGAWGKVEPSTIAVKKLGENLYAIVLEGKYFHHGIESSGISILAKVNGSLREILPFLSTRINDTARSGIARNKIVR